jgi:hypothetical protein
MTAKRHTHLNVNVDSRFRGIDAVGPWRLENNVARTRMNIASQRCIACEASGHCLPAMLWRRIGIAQMYRFDFF